ncbi:hypothetical protein [Thiomicrorhabdus sediminis]|uniref:Uncharacterized protein n=1 Tax=Thiomicrorhabdus sediminis TaxID=2580412 RepID=A0A4P9K4V8_9GAMM|nr:hypothetical protein [Thiomicrorhabdus sediminis]QCU89781.1 hypothetical protein FE785_03575 [Thiomicrorhabdus sediminis]
MPEISIEDFMIAIEQLTIQNATVAIEQLNRDGITDDSHLPFSRPTYNNCSSELCTKLQNLGVVFLPKIIGTYLYTAGTVYAIYNPEEFEAGEAVEWLIQKYETEYLIDN